MKRLFCLFLVLALFPVAVHAEETARVHFVDAAPFFFVLPDGFEPLEGYEGENSMGFVNRSTSEGVAYVVIHNESTGPKLYETLSGFPNIIPMMLDSYVEESIPGWRWNSKSELSGGCWKILGTAQNDGETHDAIFALGKTAGILIFVMQSGENKDTSLRDIVCHSLSYTEPKD